MKKRRFESSVSAFVSETRFGSCVVRGMPFVNAYYSLAEWRVENAKNESAVDAFIARTKAIFRQRDDGLEPIEFKAVSGKRIPPRRA